MGISGLLPVLKDIQVHGNISDFKGKRLAVDVSSAYRLPNQGVPAQQNRHMCGCTGVLLVVRKSWSRVTRRQSKPTLAYDDSASVDIGACGS